MDDKVPVEVKREIVKQEIQQWENASYQLLIRERVTKKIGGDTSKIVAEMENCEKAMDELKSILSELG